jgi:hypothetical protein
MGMDKHGASLDWRNPDVQERWLGSLNQRKVKLWLSGRPKLFRHVVDHVKPLKRGGADAPLNMQWQTIGAAKAKDKVE